MIREAFSLLHGNRKLMLYPILVDIVSIGLFLMTTGFSGQSKISFKISLAVGLPSVNHLIDQPGFGTNIHFFSGLSTVVVLIVILVFRAFFQGGYIGLLKRLIVDRNSVSTEGFFDYATRFWKYFVQVELFWLLIVLLGLPFVLLLNFVGALLFLVVILWIRILHIYWEFTIVLDDLSPADAFRRCREYFRLRTARTGEVIWVMIVVNFVFALLLNGMWSFPVLLGFIFLNGYVATALQIALMDSLDRIKRFYITI